MLVPRTGGVAHALDDGGLVQYGESYPRGAPGAFLPSAPEYSFGFPWPYPPQPGRFWTASTPVWPCDGLIRSASPWTGWRHADS